MLSCERYLDHCDAARDDLRRRCDRPLLGCLGQPRHRRRGNRPRRDLCEASGVCGGAGRPSRLELSHEKPCSMSQHSSCVRNFMETAGSTSPKTPAYAPTVVNSAPTSATVPRDSCDPAKPSAIFSARVRGPQSSTADPRSTATMLRGTPEGSKIRTAEEQPTQCWHTMSVALRKRTQTGPPTATGNRLGRNRAGAPKLPPRAVIRHCRIAGQMERPAPEPATLSVLVRLGSAPGAPVALPLRRCESGASRAPNRTDAGVLRPVAAGIIGADRSCTVWMISVLSIPRRYAEVIPSRRGRVAAG